MAENGADFIDIFNFFRDQNLSEEESYISPPEYFVAARQMVDLLLKIWPTIKVLS